MPEQLDTSFPSIRLVQTYVRDKAQIQLKLNDSTTVSGHLAWQDPLFYCMIDAAGKQILISREAVAVILPLS
jgi:host factor-I protein